MVTNFEHYNLAGATPERVRSVLDGYLRRYKTSTVTPETFTLWLGCEYIPELEPCRDCGETPELRALKDPIGIIRAYIYVCPNCGRTSLPYSTKLAAAVNWNDQNGVRGLCDDE